MRHPSCGSETRFPGALAPTTTARAAKASVSPTLRLFEQCPDSLRDLCFFCESFFSRSPITLPHFQVQYYRNRSFRSILSLFRNGCTKCGRKRVPHRWIPIFVAKHKTSTKQDDEWLAKVAAERRKLAELVAERLRAMRDDADIGQEKMGYLLGGLSAASIRRMEWAETSTTVVDWILWAQRSKKNPLEVFKDLMYFVDQYQLKANDPPP